MVTTDEQASIFFHQEEYLAELVFSLVLEHPNKILQIEASHVIANAISSCHLKTLLHLWVGNFGDRILKFIFACSKHPTKEERLHLSLLQSIDLLAQLEHFNDEGKFVNFLRVFEENGGVDYLEYAQLNGGNEVYTIASEIMKNYFANGN